MRPRRRRFLPALFYWFDTTFQRWLQTNQLSQAILADRFEIIGTGLIDTGALFKSPLRDGDVMQVKVSISEWSTKTFLIDYVCLKDGVVSAGGYKVRGWLEHVDGRLRSGAIPGEFRERLS